MKSRTMFCYEFLFGDHFAKVSNQAKLYYIALNFYSDRGFVANPMGVLDMLGYDKSVYWELVKNEELLTLPDRCEVFITSYYIHNDKFNPKEWYKSPFSIYWIGKLYIKKNGVATFNPDGIPQEEKEPLSNIESPSIEDDGSKKVETKIKVAPPIKQVVNPPSKQDEEEWGYLMDELDNLKKERK